jgi:hypothetical protein
MSPARVYRSGCRGILGGVQFDEVLRTWAEFFERENIRYAIIGGLAMQAWGRSRFTNDADIAVDRDSRNLVIARAEELGYETIHISEGYSNHLHPNRRFGRLDFMYLDRRSADRIFARTRHLPVAGDAVAAVAAPEHLAMMKVIAIKNNPARAGYEAEDIRLLMSLPDVDTESVREYFERHGMLDFWNAIRGAR